MPTCNDCGVQMVAHPDSHHCLLAVDPPGKIRLDQFYPVSVFQCTNCGLVKLYSARFREPEAWETAEWVA